MKFTLLVGVIASAQALIVGDGQVCNTMQGCKETTSKCCYAKGASSLAGLYDNLYCVPEGSTTLKVAGNDLSIGLCPAKDDWLPGSTGNVMHGTGGASHIAVGFTAVLAAAYVAV